MAEYQQKSMENIKRTDSNLLSMLEEFTKT